MHLFALKQFLGLDRRIPNDVVYSETNRYPLSVNAAVRCIRYWIKILHMDESRLPFKSYKMLYDLDAKGKNTWASQIRTCLCELGFGFVWLNQGVGNCGEFIKVFRQRLIDCRWQQWSDHIQTSERYQMYRQFISSHDVKPYLKLDMDIHLKRIMSKFRLGVSDINVHKFRYKEHDVDDLRLLCPLCKQAPEDEVHFVLCCPVLEDVRQNYIPVKYSRQPNLFRLCLLMASSHPEVVRSLTLYLCKAFRIKYILLS